MISLRLLPLAVLLAMPGQTQTEATTPPQQETPVFRVEVVAKRTLAFNYRHRGGATPVKFRGTELMPAARGEAKVESKQGYIEIEVEFKNLTPATRFGSEYLTYVLWAITPEGRATNLGEVLLNGTRSKLNVTTELQVFGMVMTAEPYFAVRQPSDLVVIENVQRKGVRAQAEEIEAKYELLKRGQYENLANPLLLRPEKKTPLEIYEARNAVQIAEAMGASQWASDTFEKARSSLGRAEELLVSGQKLSGHNRNQRLKTVAMTARQAVQTAEDARALAVTRQEEAEIAEQQRLAAEREAAAKARAADEAQKRARAEAERKAEAERRVRAEAEKLVAERARLQAELAAARAAQRKAEAEAARAREAAEKEAARREAESARLEAEAADRRRQRAEMEKAELRQKLLRQFNLILDTRDTERGLVVNLSDVLFDVDKYDLRPIAREKLARMAGIVLSYPELRLRAEGHTDNTGSDEYNLSLSEKRAQAVQQFLIEQGIPATSVTAVGLGESFPIADNSTRDGRQQNRRVELIVSGTVIGSQVGASPSGQ